MSQFTQLQTDDNIKIMVKSAFDMDLDISGGWGYTKKSATHISKTKVSLSQFEHNLTFMRAYIEMNMTLSEDERYSSINAHELKREQIQEEDLIYDKVSYEITAILEKQYNEFINEYKEGYGKENFDMSKHFEKRKEATLKRVVVHWFEISKV
jgi:predicted small secreted protein